MKHILFTKWTSPFKASQVSVEDHIRVLRLVEVLQEEADLV